MNMNNFTLSEQDAALCKSFESCGLIAYRDSGGRPTIGWGHTTNAGPPTVTMGMQISQADANSIFVRDAKKFVDAINSHVTVKISFGQFRALFSLVYNIGVPAFLGSTLLKHLNAGRFDEAHDEFLKWNKVKGRVVAGLTNRRAKEAAVFGDHVASAPASIIPDTPAAAAPPAASSAVKAEAPKGSTVMVSKVADTSKGGVSGAALNTANVNFFQGAINTAESLVASIESGIKTSFSSVTSGAVSQATGGSAIVASFSDGKTAVDDVKKAIADAKAGHWGNTVADGVDFLKHVFAILAHFNVNVPVASAIVAALPEMEPVSK